MSRNTAAKKATNSRKGKAKPPPATPEPASWQRRLGQEMAALLLLGLGVFCFLVLATHSVKDPWGLVSLWSASGVHNWVGKAGALTSGALIWTLGLAAFWLPLISLGLAWQSHREGLEELSWLQAAAGGGVLLASAGFLALLHPRLLWGSGWIHTGGRLGDVVAVNLAALLNPPGAALLLGLVLLVSVMGATRLSYAALLGLAGQSLQQAWSAIRYRRQTGEPLPGDYLDLRAEMDVLAVVSNCPQMNNPVNDFRPTPVRAIIYQS